MKKTTYLYRPFIPRVFLSKYRFLLGMASVISFLTFFACTTPTHAAVSANKRGLDAALNSPTHTAPGNIINWVLTYSHTGPLGTMQLDDPIPSGTGYVPGSLIAPPGYVRSFSTNGTSYDNNESAGTTHLRINGEAQPTTTATDGTSVTTGLIAPPKSFDGASASGDGFEAIFWGENIYNINHHNNTNAYIQCHTKSGATCPKIEGVRDWPTYVSANSGDSFGTGTQDYTTPNMNFSAINQANGKVYMPATRNSTSESGIACFDLSTNKSCGFTSLITGTGQIAGGTKIGSRIFMNDLQDNVHCYDLSANSGSGGLCGAPYPIKADVAVLSNGHLNGGGPDSQLTTFDNRYLFVNFHPSDESSTPSKNEELERSIGCIDTASNQVCPNFPVRYIVPDSGTHNIVLAPITNGGGTLTGVCGSATPQAATTAPFQCFNLNTGNTVAPFNQPWGQLVPGAEVGNFVGQGSTLLLGTKLYLPYRNPANDQATYACWDYAINTACDGFIQGHSGEKVAPYTLREDPYSPGCIWEVGDAGRFEVFDADVGGLDCQRTGGTAEASPAAFYCDGQNANIHFTSWDSLTIKNLAPGSSKPPRQYEKAFITIKDKDGVVLPAFNHRQLTSAEMSSGVVDLSSVSTGGSTLKLSATVSFLDVDGNAWTADNNDSNDPYLQLTWNGDAIQFCYQTTVLPCTQASGITNNATFTTTDPSTSTAAASSHLDWAQNTQCGGPAPAFSVTKAATPISGLRKGSVVTYTIITTNTGSVPLTNVITTDPLLPGIGCQPAQPTTLNPGEKVTCTGSYTVTQADANAGVIRNIATTCADAAGINNCKQSPPLDIPVSKDSLPKTGQSALWAWTGIAAIVGGAAAFWFRKRYQMGQ